ncbi:hypothetical protein MGN70_012504 [Eutypa lata]|uniref:Uncharacterized protein n=1 Tax=Eutypa lata (strain UCR-EL1) TaxID=1287681 RepID=M7T896_EUTLA|nr:hypothetical protein UCREL1_59 [Eutypa lata UCREL1]KAI1245612.1 hypothetical protein MGN70_012504 [Eutypa lata]
MSFPNIWHHRKVAETAAKGCEICYKPSSSVLVTPDNKDWFYVCPSHLTDTKFCSPFVDPEAEAARKKKEEEEEIAKLKKEYEEKQRKKKEKEAEKGKEKDDEKDKDKDKKTDKDTEKKDGTAKQPEIVSPPKEQEPKVFTLHKTFYQQRLYKKRQAENAKRMREQLRNPSFFPSVPKGDP